MRSNQYETFKNAHQGAVNAFPMFFAYSEDQFKKGMEKLGLKYLKDEDKLLSITAGGFIRKSDEKAFEELITGYCKQLDEKMRNHDFAVDAFYYELANHEYCITYNASDALDALSLTMSDLQADKDLMNAFLKARRKYLRDCENNH